MKAPVSGEFLSPDQAMTWALIVARNGVGFVSPNPMVGCVIVDRDHKFIVEGWHRQIGLAHAEVDAVERFEKLRGSRDLSGCHVYVTLEPCAHQGRTGSCAKMLAPLKPATVTYAIQDPNPKVAGQGARILAEAGVHAACMANVSAWPAFPKESLDEETKRRLVQEAEDVIEIFLWNMRNSGVDALPFVTVKVASSLDGRVALHSGESQWITGEIARKQGHSLRLEHDAIVVGRRTVESDNPTLNVRLDGADGHTNSVVVIDPKAKLIERLSEFNLAKARPADRVFICVQKDQANDSAIVRGRELGFRIFEVGGTSDGIIDLREMLRELRKMGIQSVYVEGGAGTVGPFMSANVVQRLHVFMSTSIIGGKFSTGWSDLCGVEKLSEIWKLHAPRVNLVGSDVHFTGRLIE